VNIVAVAALSLALAGCATSDEKIKQQVADDHKTCASRGEPGSTAYQDCREQLTAARREEAETSRGRGPERPLYDQ
jgi:outer membrane murein-binding lipoprotein Lpp